MEIKKLQEKHKKIIDAVNANKLEELFSSSYNFIVMLTPLCVYTTINNNTVTQYHATLDEYSSWSCIMFETKQDMEKFVNTHNDYDFIVIDISASKTYKLAVKKDAVHKSKEIIETIETVKSVRLEEIGE